MKGVTKVPEHFKVRVHFLGKTRTIGNYTSEEIATSILHEVNSVIAHIESDARNKFEEQLKSIKSKLSSHSSAE